MPACPKSGVGAGDATAGADGGADPRPRRGTGPFLVRRAGRSLWPGLLRTPGLPSGRHVPDVARRHAGGADRLAVYQDPMEQGAGHPVARRAGARLLVSHLG